MIDAVRSLTLPRSLLRSGWRTRHFVAAFLLGVVGILATIDAWSDLLRIAVNDEESSQIWLVIPVVIWLLWVRRGRLRHISPSGMWIGPILVVIGPPFIYPENCALIDVFWHAGAVLVLIGCVLTPLGWQLFRNFGVVFLAMAFLVPVPARIRQRIAIPLQNATANTTSEVCQLVGMDVEVSANLLRVNGHNVAVAEACNGMRMTFALLMVCFAFAYTIPLRGYVRILVLLMSPFSAIACNVVRLIPTVWVYGNYKQSTAELFHDATGWVMLFVAFLLLLGIIRLLRWAMLPVMVLPWHMTELKTTKSKLAGIGPTLVTLLIVGYLGVDRIFHDPPTKILDAYQAKVRDVMNQMPTCVGPWIGEDVPMEQSAVKLLHPLAYICARYSNGNGDAFTLLFVEVADSRDALGHYPQNCYPNQGWTSSNIQGEPIDWSMSGQTVHGKEYAFDRTQVGSNSQIIVDDFLVLANDTFCRDMIELEDSAYDRLRWSYGVGQVQFVFGAESTPEGRRSIVETFLKAESPIFDAMKI